MRTKIAACICIALLGGSASAEDQGKYQITDGERAACESDAVDLCSETYPDEDTLLVCMKLNLAKLTTGCRAVFLEGLHRRGK